MTEPKRPKILASALSLGELDRGYRSLAEIFPTDWTVNPDVPEPMFEDSEIRGRGTCHGVASAHSALLVP